MRSGMIFSRVVDTSSTLLRLPSPSNLIYCAAYVIGNSELVPRQ